MYAVLEVRPGHSRNERFPNQLLDVGNHFNDDPNRRIRRTVAHPRPPTTTTGIRDSNRFDRGKLPRENMCIKVMNLGMRRPAPNRRIIN